jgi:hypothetical protein
MPKPRRRIAARAPERDDLAEQPSPEAAATGLGGHGEVEQMQLLHAGHRHPVADQVAVRPAHRLDELHQPDRRVHGDNGAAQRRPGTIPRAGPRVTISHPAGGGESRETALGTSGQFP